MKKLLAFLLAISFMLAMFAGCDKSEDSDEGGSKGEGSGEQSEGIIEDIKDILGDVKLDELPSNIDEAIEAIDKAATVYTGRLFNKNAKVIFKGDGAIAGYSIKNEMTMESGKMFTASVETLIVFNVTSEGENTKNLEVVGVLTKATLGGDGLDEYYAMADDIFESLCRTCEISEGEKKSVRKIFDDYIGGKETYLKPEDKAFRMITDAPKKAILTLSESTFEAEYSWYDDDEDIDDEPNYDPDVELDVNGNPVVYDGETGLPILSFTMNGNDTVFEGINDIEYVNGHEGKLFIKSYASSSSGSAEAVISWLSKMTDVDYYSPAEIAFEVNTNIENQIYTALSTYYIEGNDVYNSIEAKLGSQIMPSRKEHSMIMPETIYNPVEDFFNIIKELANTQSGMTVSYEKGEFSHGSEAYVIRATVKNEEVKKQLVSVCLKSVVGTILEENISMIPFPEIVSVDDFDIEFVVSRGSYLDEDGALRDAVFGDVTYSDLKEVRISNLTFETDQGKEKAEIIYYENTVKRTADRISGVENIEKPNFEEYE